MNYLQALNIDYTQQFIHPNLSMRRFDFYFIHSGKHYILEFDGEQHFTNISFFIKQKKILIGPDNETSRKIIWCLSNNHIIPYIVDVHHRPRLMSSFLRINLVSFPFKIRQINISSFVDTANLSCCRIH